MCGRKRKTYEELTKTGTNEEWRDWIKTATVNQLLEVLPDVQHRKESLSLVESVLKVRLAAPHWKPVLFAAISALSAVVIGAAGLWNASNSVAARSKTLSELQVQQEEIQQLSNSIVQLQANILALSLAPSNTPPQKGKTPPAANHP